MSTSESSELDGASDTNAHTVQDAPADWSSRLGAISLDILPGAAVVGTAVLTALAMPNRSAWWWVSVGAGAAAVAWTAANRLILPVLLGHSVGRSAFGIRITERNGDQVGPWLLLIRELLHLLDSISVLGWLWPLWDPRRGTFADIAARTQARRATDEFTDRRPRRIGAVVVGSAAILCGALSAVSFFVVGQYDRAVDNARSELTIDGPRMVEQLLSYQPDTIEADFDRARALTSEGYRGELSAQQQAVRAASPMRNQYWVVKSSILDATVHDATMLMFLEGERGTQPNLRYITASVRANFVRVGDNAWRVDRLAVVTSPRSSGSLP